MKLTATTGGHGRPGDRVHRRRGHRPRHRDRQQRSHDRNAEADAVLREGVSRHQGQMGDARGRRAQAAGHDRHRHQGRPVRRHDDRHVRNADLGEEGLAHRDQARRQLRRRRPAAGDAQRPFGRRQALRRALLRRELDADVPQGPGRQGGRDVRRAPDLGPGEGRRRQDERPQGGRLRHLPARQAGLGRQHGVHHDHGQQLRRPVVRHVVEAAARIQAVARRDHRLRRAAEEIRPARVEREQLQRDPRALQRGQVRDVDRRDHRRLVHHRSRSRARSPTRSRSRKVRTAPRRRARTGSGPGRWRSRPAPRMPTRRRSSSTGRRRRTTSRWSPRRRAGARCRPGRASRPTPTRSS